MSSEECRVFVDLTNGFRNVVTVSPGRHRVGVTVQLPRTVVVPVSVTRHVTEDVRMSRGHVGQRHPQRGGRVDSERRLELQTIDFNAINVSENTISKSQWRRAERFSV